MTRTRFERNFIKGVLEARPAKFSGILANAGSCRLQILLSYVSRDSDGEPVLIRHGFRVDNEYFYPASAVKICAAVAALQKIQRLPLELPGTEMVPRTGLKVLPIFEGDVEQVQDISNRDEGHSLNVAHDIRKLFLVSDNNAFNRLYSFVGQRSINEAMWELGLSSTRIRHRLSVERSAEENRYCEAMEVGDKWCSPPKRSTLELPATCAQHGIHVGEAYIDITGEQVQEPMDFSEKNAMSLLDLQNILVKVLRPDINLGTPGIELDENLRQLLMEAMVQYPSQSRNPSYCARDYPDDYCKFFLPGLARVRPLGALRVYNKIGQAYGFSTDNSYVLNIETGQSFFLAATLLTNKNGILNDDIYEYDLAYAILADIAEALSQALWKDVFTQGVASHNWSLSQEVWQQSISTTRHPVPCACALCVLESQTEVVDGFSADVDGTEDNTVCQVLQGAPEGKSGSELLAVAFLSQCPLGKDQASCGSTPLSLVRILPRYRYFVDV